LAKYDVSGSYAIKTGTKTIAENAFRDREYLTSITIPDSVTSIGSYAFYNCTSLTNIKIPDSVTSIGSYAFYNCTSLTNIKIPDSVTSIDSLAFYGCTSLTSITIPNSVTSIGYSAFRDCTSLTSITIPDSVTSIDSYAFDSTGYYNDETNWKNKVLYIGNHLIAAKENISGSYAIKTGTKTIGSSAFEDCTSLTGITVPDSVTGIGDSTFEYCAGLTSITIPESITKIGCSAFGGCDTLQKVYYGGFKTQWERVEIYEGNEPLSKATIHYKTCSTHSYKTTTTKASLTKNGKVETKCSVCGDTKTTTIYYPKTIKLSKTEYTYNGKAQKPTVTVKDSKGNTLKNGTDYKVTYEKGRKNPGKYSVRIDFMGKYSGTKRVYFTIAPATPVITKTAQTANAIRLTWNKVTGATGYRVYQYNAKTKKWDKLKTLKDTTYRIEKLKAGTTYKFRVKAYKKDDGTIWGKATATINVATKTAAPKITKLTTTKGKAAFTWSNVAGETGYQVYYSTKKDSGFKKVTSYKADVVKGTKSKLTSGKKYYFKVRAYKKTASGTVYSAWSSVKSIKIK